MTATMTEIPEEVLPNLKCCDCKMIISSPPVYSKRNLENICGRCIPPRNVRKIMFRNKAYEQVALLLIFPCQYDIYGCNSKLKWGESEEHEKNCKYGAVEIIPCPSLPAGKCTWKGPEKDLFGHFQHNHPDLIASYPYNISQHLRWIVTDMKKLIKTTHRNMLMKAYDFLFLIQFKISYQSGTMWICATFIGNSKMSAHFECLLEFEKELVTLRGLPVSERMPINVMQVLPKILALDETKSFRITFRNKCNLSIDLNNVKCINCNASFSKLTKNQIKFCCDDWNFKRNEKTIPNRLIQRCNSYEKGCLYKDIPENMLKHEMLLCRCTKNICFKCNFVCRIGTCLLDHVKIKHYGPCFAGEIDLSIIRTKIFENAAGVLETNEGQFLCEWGTRGRIRRIETFLIDFIETNIIFYVDIMSDLPYSEEKKYNFKMSFVNSLTGQEESRLLEQDNTSLPFCMEWHTKFVITPAMFTSNDYLLYSIKIEMVR